MFRSSSANYHRPFVPVPISTVPYRRALLVNLFFYRILGDADTKYASTSDPFSTVATYFNMNTAMTKREEEKSSIFIWDSVFSVDNIAGVGFLNSEVKFVTIDKPSNQS